MLSAWPRYMTEGAGCGGNGIVKPAVHYNTVLLGGFPLSTVVCTCNSVTLMH